MTEPITPAHYIPRWPSIPPDGIAADHWRLFTSLAKIARGRTDNGQPLPREISREIARDALIKAGMNW